MEKLSRARATSKKDCSTASILRRGSISSTLNVFIERVNGRVNRVKSTRRDVLTL